MALLTKIKIRVFSLVQCIFFSKARSTLVKICVVLSVRHKMYVCNSVDVCGAYNKPLPTFKNFTTSSVTCHRYLVLGSGN